MNSDITPDLLDSMSLVGRGLSTLERAAVQLGCSERMASLEMRLAILKGRLQAGDTSPGLLAATSVLVDDFEAFVFRCFGSPR